MATNPQNTLQQDLLLIAKNRYQMTLSKVEAVRVAVAYHILMAQGSIKLNDASYWLLKEYVHTGLILDNHDKLARFLIDFGRTPSGWYPSPEGYGPVEQYHVNLIMHLLDQIRYIPVYEGDKNLLPFEVPGLDAELQALLADPKFGPEQTHAH